MLTFLDVSKWRLPRVGSGCFCCSLSTCCNVQGYLMLLLSLHGVVVSLVQICSGRHRDGCEPGASECLFNTIVVDTAAIFLFTSVVDMIGAIMLLRGVYRKNPHLVMFYIRVLYFDLSLSAVFLVWGFSFPSYRHYFIVINVMNIAMLVYMLLCTNSLYLEMIEEPRPQRFEEAGLGDTAAAASSGAAPSRPPPYGQVPLSSVDTAPRTWNHKTTHA